MATGGRVTCRSARVSGATIDGLWMMVGMREWPWGGSSQSLSCQIAPDWKHQYLAGAD